MAERSSGWVQNSGPTGVMDVEETRLVTGALVAPHGTNLKGKSGFRPGPGTSPGLVTATGTPDGFVHVSPFQLMLQSGRSTAPGTYTCTLDAQKDINILSTPADPTNPRNDLIIAQQSDTFYGDANSDFVVKQVVGTPAGSPADPAVTGSPDYITLARVRVDANATTIVSGKITDLRTTGHVKSLAGGSYSIALGGILPVASQTERDALSGVYEGFAIWRSDTDSVEVFLGGGVWRNFGRSGDFLARGRRGGDSSSSSSTTLVPIIRLDDIPILAGRLVDIRVVTAIDGSVADDIALLTLTYTTDGSTPTIASSVLGIGQHQIGNPNFPETMDWHTTYTPGSNETLSILLSLSRASGAGVLTAKSSGSFITEISIQDGGIDPGDTGTDL